MKKPILLLVGTLSFLLHASPLPSFSVLLSEDVWQCKYQSCREKFSTLADLHDHYNPHIKQANGNCWLCPSRYPIKKCNFISHLYRMHYNIPPCPLKKKPDSQLLKKKKDPSRALRKSLGPKNLCEFPLAPNHIQTHHKEFMYDFCPIFFSCNLCDTLIPIQDLKLIFQHYHKEVNSSQYRKNSKKWIFPKKKENIEEEDINAALNLIFNPLDVLLSLKNSFSPVPQPMS